MHMHKETMSFADPASVDRLLANLKSVDYDNVGRFLTNLKSVDFGNSLSLPLSGGSLFGTTNSRGWATLPGSSITSLDRTSLTDVSVSNMLQNSVLSVPQRPAAKKPSSWDALFMKDLTAAPPAVSAGAAAFGLPDIRHYTNINNLLAAQAEQAVPSMIGMGHMPLSAAAAAAASVPAMTASSVAAAATLNSLAAVAPPPTVAVPPPAAASPAATAAAAAAAAAPGNKRKRPGKSRKVVPTNKVFVDKYNDADTLCGRGARTNKHPGNKVYLKLVEDMKPVYRSADDSDKRSIIFGILNSIKDQGGRFLELDKETQRWYVIHEKTAYTKVGQALRDNNDEASRAAKRAKYGPGKKQPQKS